MVTNLFQNRYAIFGTFNINQGNPAGPTVERFLTPGSRADVPADRADLAGRGAAGGRCAGHRLSGCSFRVTGERPSTSFAASSRADQDRGRERALKIAVCIKRVPEMELRFSIAADRKSLDQGGLKYEISDFDGYALEVGAPAGGEGGRRARSSSICLGPDGVQETLRKALAMGADARRPAQGRRGPLRRFRHRDRARGRAQGRRLRPDPVRPDGDRHGERHRRADDGAAARSSLRHRDLPSRARPTAAAPPGAISRAPPRRSQFPLPAVLTIDEGIARPRLATLKGIMAAKKKPLDVQARAARRGAVSPSSPWRCRRSAPAGGSSAKAPTRCPSWCGCSAPKRRCSDGDDLRVRGIAGRRAPQGGVRDGDRRAAGGRRDRAAARCTRW